MVLPFFYLEEFDENVITLDEDRSKHIIQVLRKTKGEHILLTDGKGNKAEAEIVNDHRKKCEVRILSIKKDLPKQNKVCIAISPLKNSSRFEWFLEKATEVGVDEIVPMICERTEKENFRKDRMQNILIAAMLQSQQSCLPVLHQPVAFKDFMLSDKLHQYNKKYIAHCIESEKSPLSNQPINQSTNQLILIGPEGDFTSEEVNIALENNFTPVALGNTRLRTETAGIVAASLLCVSA